MFIHRYLLKVVLIKVVFSSSKLQINILSSNLSGKSINAGKAIGMEISGYLFVM